MRFLKTWCPVLILTLLCGGNLVYAQDKSQMPLTPDVTRYQELVLFPRTMQEGSQPEPEWKSTAVGMVVSWFEFREQFSNSSLLPQVDLRIAEWYLTIHRDDEYSSKKLDEKESGKYKPESLHPFYRQLAKHYLDRAIDTSLYAPHYSHLGEERFGYNGDTIGSSGLYTRALFFPKTRREDVCLLKSAFPDAPSAKEAKRDFPKIWDTCGI